MMGGAAFAAACAPDALIRSAIVPPLPPHCPAGVMVGAAR